jgi:Zn-finger nucleic acid-binding protein
MTTALDLFAEFAVDTVAEKEGVWCDYGDMHFLVAMSGNRKYREKFMRLYKPHERLLKGNSQAAAQKSQEIMADVMSTTILLDWKGKMVVEKGGDPVEYSSENARKALMMPKFRELISEFSNDFAQFKAVKDEEDVKN